MDPERWKQIEGLCQSALEMEREKREAYLKEACLEMSPFARKLCGTKMKNRKLWLSAFFISLLLSTPAYADVVWPELYLVSRMGTWWSISVGLIVEYLFVRKLTGFSRS